MTPRLLRASSFCRLLNAPKVEVTIKLLQDMREESTVYGSADLLVRLSIKHGDVVWLSRNGFRIPAKLCIDDEITSTTLIKIPPTMFYFGASTCYIQAHTANVAFASSVSIALLGRPIMNSVLQERTSIECPPIGSVDRLVSLGVLVSVLQDYQVFVYKVLTPGPCWTTSQTEWKLESCPSHVPTQRLPPMDRTKHYLLNKPFQESTHPTLCRVIGALQTPHDVPASHRILHVIGSMSNDADRCVEAASHSLGRRYLKVRGLAAFAHFRGRTVTTGSTQDKLAGCQAALEQAHECAPCVLHLVDLDDELPKDDEPLRHMLEMRLWTMLMAALRLRTIPKAASGFVPPVIVVLSSLAPLAAGPLLENLVFAAVTISEPDEAYARYLWNDDGTFANALPHLVGHTALDIRKWKRQWLNSKHSVAAFLEQAVKPVSQTSSQIPDIHWQDIGGLSHVRKEIMDAIELPLQHPELFQGTRRSGILLYGPPGTGKTLVAKAVATECGLPFFSVKGPELLGSYVGESEANVRQIFASARDAAVMSKAAVLFFDELDSLAPRRGGLGDGGGVMERVVATLLTELDRNDTVFLIGATNRPDLLDPSLLRPGRLDRRVYLGLPSNNEDRAQVLSALIRKFKLEKDGDPMQISLAVVNELPPHLSGADFAAVASGALMRSLKRLCEAAEHQVTPFLSLDDVLENWGDDMIPVVTAADLIAASEEVVASVTPQDLRRYQRLQEEFSSNLI